MLSGYTCYQYFVTSAYHFPSNSSISDSNFLSEQIKQCVLSLSVQWSDRNTNDKERIS